MPSPAGRPLKTRDVVAFFGLTATLTTPLWAAGAASGALLLPGLPVAALAVVCPAIAATLLLWVRCSGAAARASLARTLDAGRIKAAWWPAILLTWPAVSVASFLILRLSGSGVPDPRLAVLPIAALSGVFLVGALCEELGWTGFALEPLKARFGWLGAALLIGAFWAAWHVPALLQVRRPTVWIAWWAVGTVAARVIMVWLFDNAGGSVFGVAVFHAAGNVCWQLFPIHGSWFDPRLNGMLLAVIACAVAALGHRHSLGRLRAVSGS